MDGWPPRDSRVDPSPPSESTPLLAQLVGSSVESNGGFESIREPSDDHPSEPPSLTGDDFYTCFCIHVFVVIIWIIYYKISHPISCRDTCKLCANCLLIIFLARSLFCTFHLQRSSSGLRDLGFELKMMAFCSSLSPPQSLSVFSKTSNGGRYQARVARPFSISHCRASTDVPDFLSADWLESRQKRPFGPRLNFSAEEAVQHQLDALKYNDQPRQDYGVEVMYRFAGFDPFERSTYFGPFFDLGQFERFRRIFHHLTYRVLLGHKERRILSSLWVKENRFKQRVWILGARPEEEEIFQFTMVQRVGGSWDGYWLTESLLHDGDGFARGVAY
ncbi:hypothetical protein NE237_024857 [Protea cynaroides]|uniref:Uncharacterized protein n=1 Tax=Protea cynaroides TaxID=273540 RepID=A0A9Q0H319_9MAGN|nr:hypothetical protein NE237_024857 [Protea cynaroides]